MQIIEINALPNGAHNNQTCHGKLLEGWAYIPDDMELPESFPFVNITVDGDTVTGMETNQEAWDAVLAERAARQAEKEAVESEPSIQDDIDAMLVDQEYRITMLELGITA